MYKNYMINKKKILILGGGHEQLPGIKTAKNLGVITIVVDKNEDCPGKKHANKFYNISTNDFKNIYKIAKKENINAIVTFASELPLKIISKVCKKMNFPNLEEKVIENVINKSKSKKLFLKNNIPHVKGHSFNFNEKKNILSLLNNNKKNTYIIKPSNSYGQKGISLIPNLDNIKDIIGNAYSFSTEKKVVLEKYESGKEINLVGIVYKGRVKIVSISKRVTDHKLSFGIAFKHISPFKFPKKNYLKIKKITEKIVKVFRIDNTVIYFQFLYNSGSFKVIEIATRSPGGFMYELSKMTSNFDILKFTILNALRSPMPMESSKIITKKYKNLVIKFFTEFDFNNYKRFKIINLRAIQKMNGFIKLIIFSNKIIPLVSSSGRNGALFVTGKNLKQCNINLNLILKKIKFSYS